jgi:hypothetical protein
MIEMFVSVVWFFQSFQLKCPVRISELYTYTFAGQKGQVGMLMICLCIPDHIVNNMNRYAIVVQCSVVKQFLYCFSSGTVFNIGVTLVKISS